MELYELGWVKWRSYPTIAEFYCTVPACVNTVSGVSIRRQNMMLHMACHKARGHLDLAEEFCEPKEVSAPHLDNLVKDTDLYKDLYEDAEVDENTDADSVSAYGDANDYEGEGD